jgi:transcription factor MBP1
VPFRSLSARSCRAHADFFLSQVTVYLLIVIKIHVMCRCADNWINATHILKVANIDKPKWTPIFAGLVKERTGKVQSGYAKYQGCLHQDETQESGSAEFDIAGTWVPLQDGRRLAKSVGV